MITSVKNISVAAVFLAMLIVMSQLAVPFPGGVPMTLQTLGIGLVGSLLPVSLAAMVVFLYLLMAAVGLPVLAGGSGSIAAFFSASGGYLFGFFIQAVLISWWLAKFAAPNYWQMTSVNLIAALLQLLLGTLWMVPFVGGKIAVAFAAGFFPFILPGLVKVAVVTLIATRLRQITAQQIFTR